MKWLICAVRMYILILINHLRHLGAIKKECPDWNEEQKQWSGLNERILYNVEKLNQMKPPVCSIPWPNPKETPEDHTNC